MDEATHVYSKTRQVYRQLHGDRVSTTTITTTTYLEKNPSVASLVWHSLMKRNLETIFCVGDIWLACCCWAMPFDELVVYYSVPSSQEVSVDLSIQCAVLISILYHCIVCVTVCVVSKKMRSRIFFLWIFIRKKISHETTNFIEGHILWKSIFWLAFRNLWGNLILLFQCRWMTVASRLSS